MKTCTVSVRGSDGQTHSMEVTASSLFEAVEQATREFARLWWWNGEEVAEVRAGGELWRVSVERVRQWRTGRLKPQK